MKTDPVSLADATETARRLYRGLEMQAGLMRDHQRTGGWEGADRVASAFERQSVKAKELHDFLAARIAEAE